jgi:hypothetical protein
LLNSHYTYLRCFSRLGYASFLLKPKIAIASVTSKQ